jgi:hypothetical protein
MNPEIVRVFFHELGHFVANELNRLYYKGHSISRFIIQPFNRELNLYEGEVKLAIPEEAKSWPPLLDELPQILGSLMYGSLFQAIHMDQELNDAVIQNGRDDYEWWRNSLSDNDIPGCASKFKAVENEYFAQLKEDVVLLLLLKIQPSAFLTEDEDGRLTADLDRLRAETEELILKHFDTYKTLIAKYQGVLNLAREGRCLD